MDVEGYADSHPLVVPMWLTEPLGIPRAEAGEWTSHMKRTVAWSLAVPGKTAVTGERGDLWPPALQCVHTAPSVAS